MTRRRPVRSEVWESEPIWTRALLLRDSDGGAMTISDASSWSLFVYDLNDFGLVYGISDQAPSDGAMFDTLQTSGWTGQAAGYNFAHSVQPSDASLLGDRAYRLEYTVESVTDGRVSFIHVCNVQGMYSV